MLAEQPSTQNIRSRPNGLMRGSRHQARYALLSRRLKLLHLHSRPGPLEALPSLFPTRAYEHGRKALRERAASVRHRRAQQALPVQITHWPAFGLPLSFFLLNPCFSFTGPGALHRTDPT